jgi:hypothetical protein
MKGYNLAAILLCLSFSFQTWADEQEHTARQQHEAGVPANNSPEILAKWAQLIPASDHSSSPSVSVRVVLKGNHTPCKGILTSFVPPIAETEARPNSDKERFDITVCENFVSLGGQRGHVF